MTQPTLQEIFGAGAVQTATTITILKADLPFTATATNNGEQVLASIIKNASPALTAAKFNLNPDQSIVFSAGFEQIAYRTENNTPVAYLKTPITLEFHKAQTSAGITPDDY